MQTGIHPIYQEAKVVCACGNQFVTRSTLPLIKVDICSNCHPFFTGQQKLIDSAGRVEKFGKRFAKTSGKTVVREKTTQKKIATPLTKMSSSAKKFTSTPVAAPTKDKKKAH